MLISLAILLLLSGCIQVDYVMYVQDNGNMHLKMITNCIKYINLMANMSASKEPDADFNEMRQKIAENVTKSLNKYCAEVNYTFEAKKETNGATIYTLTINGLAKFANQREIEEYNITGDRGKVLFYYFSENKDNALLGGEGSSLSRIMNTTLTVYMPREIIEVKPEEAVISTKGNMVKIDVNKMCGITTTEIVIKAKKEEFPCSPAFLILFLLGIGIVTIHK